MRIFTIFSLLILTLLCINLVGCDCGGGDDDDDDSGSIDDDDTNDDDTDDDDTGDDDDDDDDDSSKCEAGQCLIDDQCRDDGELNPDNECLVCDFETNSSTWSFVPAQTACGSDTETECDAPDSCDGAGSCLDNFVAENTACGSDEDTDCDNPDTCDGAGTCLDNYVAEDTACGSSEDNECTDPDTCDGAGTCEENNEDDETSCLSYGECTSGKCECLPGFTGDNCEICRTYVDVDCAAPEPDGQSWETAYTMVQEGIDAAEEGYLESGQTESCEVWVAEGTYFIYGSIEENEDHKDDMVTVAAGLSLLGGFDGEEESKDDRDWLAYPTILNGREEAGSANRVYHVLGSFDHGVIDGFYITAGYAQYNPNCFASDRGGGMALYYDNVTVSNCHFFDNYAEAKGGGLAAYTTSGTVTGLTIDSCIFTGNVAGDDGGAVYIGYMTDLTIQNTLVAGNNHTNSNRYSAGLYASDVTGSIDNCVFTGNKTAGVGAAIALYTADIDLTNTTVAYNESVGNGGGIYARTSSTLSMTNTLIWYNESTDYITDNIYNWDSTVTDEYCNVEDSAFAVGTGSMSSEPAFETSTDIASFWSDVSYSDYITTLEDNSATWVADELVGLFLQPDTTDARSFPILSNSATEILIRGDLTSWVSAEGNGYWIYSLKPGDSSPVIDAAHGMVCTEQDFSGADRYDDLDVVDVFDCTGLNDCISYADIGAYEYRPAE